MWVIAYVRIEMGDMEGYESDENRESETERGDVRQNIIRVFKKKIGRLKFSEIVGENLFVFY